jgi:hypothetical protein
VLIGVGSLAEPQHCYLAPAPRKIIDAAPAPSAKVPSCIGAFGATDHEPHRMVTPAPSK